MNREIKYAIENQKFKTDFSEYFFFIFFVLILTALIGLFISVIFFDTPYEIKLAGLVFSGGASFFLYNLIRRFKQLNQFEQIKTGYDFEKNCELLEPYLSSPKLKKIDWHLRDYHIIVEIKDLNWPFLNVRSGHSYWITIIIQDNYLLVNERPTVMGILFWFDRNQVFKLKKICQKGNK